MKTVKVTMYECSECGYKNQHECSVLACEKRHEQDRQKAGCKHEEYEGHHISAEDGYDGYEANVYRTCTKCGIVESLNACWFEEEDLKALWACYDKRKKTKG